MLTRIINHLQQQNKKVFFISIPNLELVKKYPTEYKLNLYNRQLSAFTKKYGFVFWDGYQVFDSIKPENLHMYHLNGDMHWNKQACYMFARKLYESKLLQPDTTYYCNN